MLKQRLRENERKRVGQKRCSRCGVPKPLDDFHTDRSRPDGRVGACKACIAAHRRSVGHYRSITKAWRKRNPDWRILNSAKSRAKKLGLTFDLVRADIVVPDRCPVLGIPLWLAEDRLGDNSPTLDRIDNSKGYVRGNVCVISWRANRLKNDATLDDLRQIVAYMEASAA